MCKEKFTKEFIVYYLKNYYETSKKIPIARDKQHPFSDKTVLKKFGSWNNALSIANIPFSRNEARKIKCKQCEKDIIKLVNQINKSKNDFCSLSCSAIYNNKHRLSGTCISKLELYLQKNLNGYNFEYNNRKICNGLELDIFIPELKLAFEINGVFHYEAIYGLEKLENTIRKDKLKAKLCKELGITLIIIIDKSNKFNVKYGEVILCTIYQHIHKHIFKSVLHSLKFPDGEFFKN